MNFPTHVLFFLPPQLTFESICSSTDGRLERLGCRYFPAAQCQSVYARAAIIRMQRTIRKPDRSSIERVSDQQMLENSFHMTAKSRYVLHHNLLLPSSNCVKHLQFRLSPLTFLGRRFRPFAGARFHLRLIQPRFDHAHDVFVVRVPHVVEMQEFKVRIVLLLRFDDDLHLGTMF